MLISLRYASRFVPSTPPQLRPAEVPLWLVVISAVVLVSNVVMMFAGGILTGVATDEWFHVERLQSWFETGWYLVRGTGLAGSDPRADYVYAPIAALVAHVLTVALGVEIWGSVSTSPNAYALRHIAIGIFGLAGLFSTGMITRILLGSWRWGLVAAATLSAIPMWTGHAMFNIKDTPVASGYSLATLGLLMLAIPQRTHPLRQVLTAMLVLVLGLVIALGVRPGIWPALVGSSILLLTVGGFLDWRNEGSRVALEKSALRFFSTGMSWGISCMILFLIYPKAFANFSTLAVQSVAGSADFGSWERPSETSWRYIAGYVSTQMPMLLLAFVIIGILGSVATVWISVTRRGRVTFSTVSVIGCLLVLTQAFLMPLAVIWSGSTLYNGLRQILFVVPALAVLAVLGIWWSIETTYRRSGSTNGMARIVSIVAGIALVAPTLAQIQLFPYNYIFYNRLATLEAGDLRFPTDYWQTSLREAVAPFSKDSAFYCPPDSDQPKDPGALTGRLPLENCFQSQSLQPYVNFVSRFPALRASHPETYLYAKENQGLSLAEVPSNCEVVNTVSRRLQGRTLLMSYVAQCGVSSR